MDGVVIILLVALVFLGPWLFGKLWASTTRNTIHKSRNQRAQELYDRRLRFEVPDAPPRAVVEAIVDEAGFRTQKSVKDAVCITAWDHEHIRFEYTNKLNLGEPGFISILEVTGSDDDGVRTRGDYQVAEAYQFDGRAAGVEEMAGTEQTIRSFIQWKFPETRILA